MKESINDKEFIEKISSESTKLKVARVKKFDDAINTTTNFNYLLKKKIKLFSHKESDTKLISESLFGSELTLKKIFNNLEETIKLVLWDDLLNLLLIYNQFILLNNKNDVRVLERIEKIQNHIVEKKNMSNTRQNITKLLNMDNANNTTNNLINDIFNGFESSMEQNTNSFDNILKLGQTITEKYKDKLENGEIDLSSMINNISNLPGLEGVQSMMEGIKNTFEEKTKEPQEKIIIDENFSTANVVVEEQKEESSNITNLLKSINNPKLKKVMNVFNKLSTSEPSEIKNILETEMGISMDKVSSELDKMINQENKN